MPIEIADWNDLDNVRNDLTGDYVLVNDLDSETDGYAGIGDDFSPIGDTSTEFTGTFDGDGNIIYDIEIKAGQQGVALFGGVDTSTAVIENFVVSGTSLQTDDSEQYTAGIVGLLSDGSVQNCVSNVDVSSNGNRVGCVIGEVNGGDVEDCYGLGDVDGGEAVGGFCGQRSGGTISESFSVGSVTGDDELGGLVGREFGGTVDNSYWDVERSGQDTSVGGTGLTTAEMQGSEAETNMVGFDFENVWETVE